jgi:hypothetical protein
MGEDSASTGHAAAQAMLDTFASVGATRFDVTCTTRAGDKEEFQRGVSLTELGRTLPHMLDTATARERDVIVRPHGPDVTSLHAGLVILIPAVSRKLQQKLFRAALDELASPRMFMRGNKLPTQIEEATCGRPVGKCAREHRLAFVTDDIFRSRYRRHLLDMTAQRRRRAYLDRTHYPALRDTAVVASRPWPSSTWMMRMSVPASGRWVAKPWRRVWTRNALSLGRRSFSLITGEASRRKRAQVPTRAA